MSGFSSLNALIQKKQSADAPAPDAAPQAQASAPAAAPVAASSFGGLNALIAKKTGVAPTAPDSSNPIIGAAQKAGRGLGSALGTVGNALDLPLAAAENVITGKGLGRIPEDLAAGAANGGGVAGALSNVAENDVYFRKGSLQRVAEDPSANPQQKAQSQFFLAHPWLAGAADFATEFANPSNLLTAGVGRVVGAAARIPQVAQGLDEIQASTRLGSRFAGLRVAGRDVARAQNPNASAADLHAAAQRAEQWGRRVVNSGGVADEGAYHQAMSDFGNLTLDQQKEVVHRAQGNVTQTFDPATEATINKNAQSVVKNIWQATRDQLKQGVIDPSKIYGRDEMFPGVFDDITDVDAKAVADYARGEMPEAERFTPEVQERGDLLKEQLAKDEPPTKNVSYFPMAGAFNQPGRDEEYLDFLDHHMGGGPGKIAERKGTAGLNFPGRTHQTLLDAQTNSKVGLRDDWSPAESYYRFLAQRSKNVELEKAMTDLMSSGLAKPATERTLGDRFGNVKDIQSTRMFGSPVLKEAAAHQRVITFLEEVGATKGEASSFAHATTALGRAAQALAPVYQTSQNVLRQSVIANPIIHAGWNLMGQYLAAGGDIRYLAGVNDAIARDAEKYGAITSRGAPRSISGGSDIALATRPISDMNLGEQVQRRAAQAQEWNAKVVFDQAERRYSSALYQTYIKRGMAPEEAGNRVRQALGDYANVSNAGPDKYLQKLLFFYPWARTLVPFWLKVGLTQPQHWNAPIQGLATHNELAGDPNFGTDKEKPFTLYAGSVNGRPQYYSVPVVERITSQIADLVGGALTLNKDMAKKGAKELVINRLNPVVGGAAAATGDLLSGNQQPYGAFGYAPVLERLQNGLQQLGDFVPAPVRAAADFGQKLLNHEPIDFAQPVLETGGFTGYVSLNQQQRRAASHIESRFYRIADAALKRNDRATAWKAYQQMQTALQRAGLAYDQPKRNPEKPDELNPMPLAPPPGAEEQHAVEAPEAPEQQGEPE